MAKKKAQEDTDLEALLGDVEILVDPAVDHAPGVLSVEDEESVVVGSQVIDLMDVLKKSIESKPYDGPLNEAGKPNRTPTKGDRRGPPNEKPKAGGRRHYDPEV